MWPTEVGSAWRTLPTIQQQTVLYTTHGYLNQFECAKKQSPAGSNQNAVLYLHMQQKSLGVHVQPELDQFLIILAIVQPD